MTTIPPNEVHGSSTVRPVGEKKRAPIWPWLLLLALLIGAALLAMRGCRHHEATATAGSDGGTIAGEAGTPPVGVKKVTLPGGASLDLEASSLNYLLQEYLASSAAAPRTFVFDRLNFATASAELPTDAQATVDALAQILKAYPAAKIRLDGYADARGTAEANAQLGARRADSVATALKAKGIASDRITTATGGESNPIDTNATPQGRAENRRTELVVTAK